MKRALVIRHVPDEDLAAFRAPILAAGYAIDTVDVTDPAFGAADVSTPDLLVLMGGPMGVYERADHPWLDGEIEKLRARLAADRPTLGVCLGAQLIAAALGARVYAGPVIELGFAPVDVLSVPSDPLLTPLCGVPVLHWHGDTFDLPAGCEPLASTRTYANQAFRRGRNVLAVQFHPEVGEDPAFAGWVAESADYLERAGVSEAALLADHARLGPAAATAGATVLGDWLDRIT